MDLVGVDKPKEEEEVQEFLILEDLNRDPPLRPSLQECDRGLGKTRGVEIGAENLTDGFNK